MKAAEVEQALAYAAALDGLHRIKREVLVGQELHDEASGDLESIDLFPS